MTFPLSEGTYTVDASKKFIPFDPKKDDLNKRPASLLVDIVPFLIKTKNDLIVIDPGLGFEGNAGDYQVQENISKTGFSPDDVTIVLLSHLHKDHVGGIGYGQGNAMSLMFPQAAYYYQEKEMEFALKKKNSESYLTEKLQFLHHSLNAHLLNGDGKINEEIHFEVSGGHTPFHQVFLIEADGQLFFFGGDVLPQPSQLQRRFVAKYDYNGEQAATRRIEYGKLAAAENRICLFFHSAAISMAKVKEEDGKFLIEKIIGVTNRDEVF